MELIEVEYKEEGGRYYWRRVWSGDWIEVSALRYFQMRTNSEKLKKLPKKMLGWHGLIS